MKQARRSNPKMASYWARAVLGLPRKSTRLADRSARMFLSSMGVTGPAVFSYTTQTELAQLLRLALEAPEGAAMLEIGAHLGASARYLAAGAASRGGRLYCIDTWQNQTMPEGERDTYAEFARNVAALADWIVPVRKASEDLTQSDIPEPVHLAFIDGDHSYEAVRRDVDLVLPLMADDPVIAFHDTTTYAGVARCLGEMLASGDWKIGGNVQTLSWIVRARW